MLILFAVISACQFPTIDLITHIAQIMGSSVIIGETLISSKYSISVKDASGGLNMKSFCGEAFCDKNKLTKLNKAESYEL